MARLTIEIPQVSDFHAGVLVKHISKKMTELGVQGHWYQANPDEAYIIDKYGKLGRDQ